MSFSQSKGQTGSGKYEIIKQKIYPIRNLTRYEVGPKIAAFCYGYEMVLIAVYNKDNIEKELGQLVRGESVIQDTNALRSSFACCYIFLADFLKIYLKIKRY